VARVKWRVRDRKEELPEDVVRYMADQTLPDCSDDDDLKKLLLTGWGSPSLAALWREHGAGITADWIRGHPGTRPWCWWLHDASEPRRCLTGAEPLFTLQHAGDFAWVWKRKWGAPAFVQCRPPGYVGLPTVESQAAYLARHGLLGTEERAALRPDAFEPEAVDPFTYPAHVLARVPKGARLAD